MRSTLTFLTFYIFLSTATYAQKIDLITIDQLQQRFKVGKDTLYVINLWATWCAPCVKELPAFEKLQYKYAKEPLKVILLSTDFRSQLESKVIPLVKRMNLQNEVFLADKKNEQDFIESMSKDWEGAIPATLFVNNKKAIWKFYSQEFSLEELERTYQSLK